MEMRLTEKNKKVCVSKRTFIRRRLSHDSFNALPIDGRIDIATAHDAADLLVPKQIRRGEERSDRESARRLDL